MRISKAALASMVDELGQVKAQAADLAEKENSIKAKLIGLGVTEAEGELFRVTVSTADRESRDQAFKDLIEQLVEKNTTPQFRAAHTKKSQTTSVRVVARVQKKEAA